MVRPLRIEFPGAVWHLTNRGVNRQDIFFDSIDRQSFVRLLARVVARYGWLLHAWVEMTNHYHLLVETPDPNLSRGMKDLDGDYAQKFNLRHGRVGHLFQGRFGGQLIQKQTHLLNVIRYVVLNPVRAHMVETPGQWTWSSYSATAGLRRAPEWLAIDWTLEQFQSADRRDAHRCYREFVAEEEGMRKNPWEELRSGLFLGTAAFGEMLQGWLGDREGDAHFALEQRRLDRPGLEEIEVAVCEEFGLSSRTLRRARGGRARAAFAFLAREGGQRLRLLGECLGISESGVSKLIRSGGEMMHREPGLRKRIEARLRAHRRT